MIKAEWKLVLNKIAVELGHFILVLIGLFVAIVYITHNSEAASLLEPTMPLLIAGGFLAISLIMGGKR